MNIHVSTHLQHVWYLCDCCSSQVNSVQSRSQAPAFHHFQYVNGNLGRDLGAKLMLLHIHALSNLQKCTLPTILSVYFLNFLQLHHRLKPGEAMTFNNRRFIHSRTAFKLNGGMRHLQVLLMLVITVECIMCLLHTVILTNCLHTLLCISVVKGLCFRF